ncbi:Helitron helicase [Phytophthora megakarya]|uniref:Helitron helicase n=1 Tax=Phytophthora megakarya TaxID=4795 RepID=A0A225VVN7_9STRA|nr:Helitron helicase [Phytophthora megakarya]
MTEEEHERHKEAKRFRCRPRQYQKGLSYYEDVDPSIIPGGRHYFSRYTDDTQEHERVCSDCNAWKFPNETDGSCCRKGLVSVPTARCAPVELRRLYRNPGFKQLIRAYNNGSVFTSMGSSWFRHLNVDKSITWSQSGVYNFRVQGYVCHRMGSLLPPPNRRPMYAQVYINYPDMQARVASRMDMTDGLDKDILETIDQVMTTHNPYSQQFINARSLLIENAGPEYQLAVEEFAHRDRADDENFKLRLHVARNSNPGTNNTPTASEVAGIIIDRGAAEHRDIILHPWQGGLERIFETRARDDPLQYHLLFPYGIPG